MTELIDVATAKTTKYASRESGDTVEIIERPTGGLSVVLVDGQGSGRSAKALGLSVSSRVVALLAEGVRDSVVARAAHDALFAHRHGQVSATLDILSADVQSRGLVVTRNAVTDLLVGHQGDFAVLPAEAGPIGRYRHTRPSVVQFPFAADLVVIAVSDGIATAGCRRGAGTFDLLAWARASVATGSRAIDIADGLLAAAIARDDGRPGDDMTVVVLLVRAYQETIAVRRSTLEWPVP